MKPIATITFLLIFLVQYDSFSQFGRKIFINVGISGSVSDLQHIFESALSFQSSLILFSPLLNKFQRHEK